MAELARRSDERGLTPMAFERDKPLYTISVAAEILETHPRTLMIYEDVGLVIPHRTSTNRRRYSQKDIQKLQLIQTLTRHKGVNLAGVKHILALLRILKQHNLAPPPDLLERDIKELDLD